MESIVGHMAKADWHDAESNGRESSEGREGWRGIFVKGEGKLVIEKQDAADAEDVERLGATVGKCANEPFGSIPRA